VTHQSEIERIPAPPVDLFEADYLFRGKPVIITNLFQGQPLAGLSTVDRARASLGDVQLEIKEEFITSLGKNMNAGPREVMSFKDYLAFAAANPGSKKMSTEGAFPREVRALFQTPAYAQTYAEPGLDDLAYQFFLGNAGNYAHLHFDGDYRHVLHYQAFGTKRVILIPVTQSKKLNPIRNYSTILVENFAEEDKAAFVQYTQGYDCILHPGDTLFMPACIWHHLEYTETSMSLSIRFGRNRHTRLLSEIFHPNMYLQSIAARLIDESAADAQYSSVLDEMEAAYRQPYYDSVTKAKQLEGVFKAIYHKICPDSFRGDYSLKHSDDLAEKFLRIDAARLYRNPLNLASTLMGWSQLTASSSQD
jgi:lysine-specific demethylase 8